MIPLFADDIGTSLACFKWGRGTVFMMPGGWALSNQGIKHNQNLDMVLCVIGYRGSKNCQAVTFDEHHHGYGSEKGMLSLISPSAKLGLGQIAVAFLIVLAAGFFRFGRVIPLREGARQRGEYLSSMSALLKKSHTTKLVWEELGKRFVADVARSVGLSPNAHVDDIIDAVSVRFPDKANEISSLCTAAIRSEDSPTEAATLAMVRKWHQMRKELIK